MRPLAVALMAIIAVITTTGCWREADDSDEGRSELRDYAAAMRPWWVEVTGGELSGHVWSYHIDHSRIREDYGSDPLPPVEPPSSMRVLHELLVNTVITVVRAESNAHLQGSYAGVAAALCDPSSLDTALWPEAAALQRWRWRGEACRDSERWAGSYLRTGNPWRDFEWVCGNYDQLWGFGVSSYGLEDACQNAAAWGHAFDLTTRAWSAELVRLCDGQEVFRSDPTAGLAACE